MDVLVVALYLRFVCAVFAVDLSHIETFVQENRYCLKQRYRPLYHISAAHAWTNHPSAFVYYKRQYHIFYQYHPYNGAWGPISWGHVVSDNLVDWTFYPPALIPGELYDKHGCLSGSAIAHNGYLVLFYTGNAVSENATLQTQNVAISTDGIVFQKYIYNPVVRDGAFGAEDSRNPKVWRFRNVWYMLLTNTREGVGRLLLYTSMDLFNWKLNGTLALSLGDTGYAWESPDLIEIDGQHVLMLCLQGVPSDGFRFKNLYQTGYIVTNFNYVNGQFDDLEVSTATFTELDHGHDFYAPKTVLAVDGRRLLIGWLGMWESHFKESKHGWASMLTIVREMKLTPQGRLQMPPVREVAELRTEILEDAWYNPGEAFYAGTRTFELIVSTAKVFYDVAVIFEWDGDQQYTVGYSADRGHIIVDRGGVDGLRRADWAPNDKLKLRIFVDYSSIEVFCGSGDVVFSSRVYPKKNIRVKISGESQLHVVQYKLRRSVGYDSKLRKYLKEHVLERA
ncbi:uncharacterized protein LOC114241426 [Bombyx mandarina]|uniref:Sucrose-6-phosphate hydrolase n=1 Tax=Bombyx mandarina TaxID=7092 RepID=A0A6J2JF07_BOMMA|nr:uncharacterized protein LOC114241426 [Bombyx mandarina]